MSSKCPWPPTKISANAISNPLSCDRHVSIKVKIPNAMNKGNSNPVSRTKKAKAFIMPIKLRVIHMASPMNCFLIFIEKRVERGERV